MKKYLLIFAATGLLFASCGSTTEETIDSNLTEVELETKELREQAAIESETLNDQTNDLKDIPEEKVEIRTPKTDEEIKDEILRDLKEALQQ